MNTVHVALATDRNYLNYALTACASMLHYTSREVVLHLLHEALSQEDIARFEALPHYGKFTVRPHKIEAAFFKDWPPMRWSVSAYYRLILPEIVPELDKILYLDCDLLVVDDIGKLFDFDLGGRTCAAGAVRLRRKHYDAIGLAPERPYFNSGVMLFDPSKMRRENHVARFISLFEELGDRIKYPDQDILNLAYLDDCLKLPLRWNLYTAVYRNIPLEPHYTCEETLAALKNPGIVHFTGRHKPWIFGATTHHPYASFYPFFADMAGFPPRDLMKLKFKFRWWFTGILKSPKEKVPWGPEILKKRPDPPDAVRP